jgi:integrase
MHRSTPHSLLGIRVPKLRQRRDGRWFARTRVGGNAKDFYFGRESSSGGMDAIKKAYQRWSLQFAAEQLGRLRAPPCPRPVPITNSQQEITSLHACFEAWFQEVQVKSAARKAKHNSRNATSGRFDKDHYSARHLSELVLAHKPTLLAQLGIRDAEALATRALQAATSKNVKVRWTRQKLVGVIRMVKRFATWALARELITTSFATALQQQDLFQAAKDAAESDESRKANRFINTEEIAKLRACLASNPMWHLVFELQLLNGARASEVLGLRSAQLTLDNEDLIEFTIPHKSDRFDSSADRKIRVAGDCLPKIRWLMATVGDDHLFNCRSRALMRNLGGEGVTDPRGSRARYEMLEISPARYSHNAYRKLLRRHGINCGTHAVRRRAITFVARAEGLEPAIEFAGHADARMLKRYLETDHKRSREIIRGRANQPEAL